MIGKEDQSSGEQDAYEDRNLLALAFLRQIHSVSTVHLQASSEYQYGYYNDTGTGDDWRVVWADIPGVGQVSWHVEKELVEGLDWLPETDNAWDGHDREEKNERLKSFIGLGAKSEEVGGSSD